MLTSQRSRNDGISPATRAWISTVRAAAASVPDGRLVDEAIAWYQAASLYFREGALRDARDDDDPPAAKP